MTRYLDDQEQGGLKSRLYSYLQDKAKRREDVTSSKTYNGLEDAIMKQKEFADKGAFAGALGNAAGQIGTIDGKSAKSGVNDFVDRINESGQQALGNYRGVRDMEERANMNDLGVANYLTALDTKDETNKYRDKVFNSNEQTASLNRQRLQQQLDAKRGVQRKLNDNIQGPHGEPVLLDESGGATTLPGYKLRDKPMGAPGTGTWSTQFDGAGNPYQTNSKTGTFRKPDLPLGFTPKTPAASTPKVTDNERNAGMMYQNAQNALKTIEEIEAKGYKPDWGTAVRNGIPDAAANYFRSDDEQRYRRAAEDFTAAKLRLESGANVPMSEIQQQARIYMMQPGQSPAATRDAQMARKTALDGMRMRAAGAVHGGFPRKVRNGTKSATVSNEQQLKEAQAEGFQ